MLRASTKLERNRKDCSDKHNNVRTGVGEKRAETHGPPSRKAHGRLSRSLFRYGLDRPQGILTTLERQHAAFEAFLQALRSPSRCLPGT